VHKYYDINKLKVYTHIHAIFQVNKGLLVAVFIIWCVKTSFLWAGRDAILPLIQPTASKH